MGEEDFMRFLISKFKKSLRDFASTRKIGDHACYSHIENLLF